VQPDFVTLMWLRSVRRKAKKQQRKSVTDVFPLCAYSKWGVPQTPESNTKVLLVVAHCAKLLFWIRATSPVMSVTKSGCTNSGATWFCYANVAAHCSTQSGKQQR
jgi:hypothetical protein